MSGDPASDMLEVGAQVGRYVVRKPIGVGGMGVVYLAHDPDLDRLVALKLLVREEGSESARAALLSEAQAIARLSHPNVVAVYDVGSYDGGSFIALEYIQGGTLREWLRRENRSWSQIVQALIHAGRGLAAAHAAGLVHRDFKPDNVLIGADGRVRVADFGLARRLDVGLIDGELGLDVEGHTIHAGHLAGTPGYMAPEQLREGDVVDARSDLFAFCITLWEALAGSRPFGGATFTEHIQRVLGGQLQPFPRDTGVPLAVIQGLQRGLALDPDARWSTLGELLKVLSAALGEDPQESHSLVRPFEAGEAAGMPSSLGHRYRLIEPFAGGTLGPIYRARDRLEGQLVAIKRVFTARGVRTGEDGKSPRSSLARALHRSLALRHPNLVGILDFGLDEQGAAYFVLDLADSARPLLSAAGESPRAIQVHLVGQLLRALVYLHRRGRVGVELNHQSVVVVGDRLRLIDTDWLGSGAPDGLEDTLSPSSGGPKGPRGAGARTVADDLYAVGALMVALFDGAVDLHDESRNAALLSAARAGELARSSSIEGPLAGLLSRLVADEPGERPSTAEEVLLLLAEATGIDLPLETVHTRESFLQGAGLVGRDEELGRLTEALRASVGGRGHALALGGESGVGKSRVLEEVWALGLVHGAVVLHGYATREGGRLFDAWRPLLRWLVISSPLTDLEASVLRIGVPDIDLLVGRPVPSAPELDASAAQLRLFQAIFSLLRRQTRPLVILLEDLHWARSESLDLLAALSSKLDGLHLLIVGSYRDDEAPGLFAEAPGVERRRLGRLDRAGVEAVVAGLVGDVGRRPELIDRLLRETEGNAHFIVEVMRELAEEAGSIEAIASMPLPAEITAGGVRKVLQRRLSRLSRPSRRILEIAAVSGRDFDLELLDAVEPIPDRDERIAEAELRGVVERHGGKWRFSHDKLRESLFGDLREERRREIHAKLAEALEALSDRDRTEELAYHFRALGRADKELIYVARAGERVVRTSPREGALLLTRAVELGQAAQGRPLDIARWQRMIADAHYLCGEMPTAIDDARAALQTLGYGWPRSSFGWVLMLLGQLVVQLAHILRRPRGAVGERGDRLREAGKIAARATQIYVYSFEQLPLLASSLRAVNLAQRAGYTEARSIAFLAYAAGLMGSERLAERYFAEGHAGAESSDDVSSLADLGVMAAVFATGRGEFSRAVELGRGALAVSRESGFALGVAQAEGILGCVDFYRGDLQGFFKSYKRAVESLHGSKSGHLRGITWGMCWAMSELGRDDEAMARSAEVLAATPPHEKLHLAMLHSLRAVLLTRKGRLTEAVEAADETMRHADVGSVPGNTPIILSGPAEAYIAAWESNLSDPSVAAGLRKKARAQLRAIRLWARLNPIGRPLVDLLGGRISLLDGDPTKAQGAWSAALSQAEVLGLGLWEGQAHLYLALYGDRRLRDRHRSTAEHLLRRCGASFRLGPVGSYNALLSSTPE